MKKALPIFFIGIIILVGAYFLLKSKPAEEKYSIHSELTPAKEDFPDPKIARDQKDETSSLTNNHQHQNFLEKKIKEENPPTSKPLKKGRVPREKIQATRSFLQYNKPLPLEGLFYATNLFACKENCSLYGKSIQKINDYQIVEKKISLTELDSNDAIVILDKKNNRAALWNKTILVHTNQVDELIRDLENFPKHKRSKLHETIYALDFNLPLENLTSIIEQLKATSSIKKVELDLLYNAYEPK